jgi:hypothetical protein
MNERINELLKQSRTEYWTQYTPSYDYEKFAELIIAECTGVLFDESEKLSELSFNEDSWQAAKEYEICSDQCIDDIAVIEKHFGVNK